MEIFEKAIDFKKRCAADNQVVYHITFVNGKVADVERSTPNRDSDLLAYAMKDRMERYIQNK